MDHSAEHTALTCESRTRLKWGNPVFHPWPCVKRLRMETIDHLTDRVVIPPDVMLDALSLLTQPIKGTMERTKAGHVISFEGILQETMKNLEKRLSEEKKFESVAEKFIFHAEEDVHWKFVVTCLNLLKVLNDSMQEAVKKFNETLSLNVPVPAEDRAADSSVCSMDSPQKISDNQRRSKKQLHQAPPDVLSVEQQKTVSTVMQFIVCLGVCPCLSPGVGVPVEFRSGYGQLLKSRSKALDVQEKVKRLSKCADILIECALQSSLRSLVLTSHLNDLLAVLLQLCYGYTKNKTGNKDSVESKKQSTNIDDRLKSMDLVTASPGTVVDALLSTAAKDSAVAKPCVGSSDESFLSSTNQKYEKLLNDLLKSTYPPILVRELVVLQGGPRKMARNPSLPPAPVWLRRVCGRLLSEQVMKPLGVHHVLRGLLEGTEGASQTSDGSGAGDDWKKCNAVAKIIANCPMQAYSVEEYYKLICPQVLDLFHIKDNLTARQFLRVACSIVSAMVTQYPDLAKKYIINPVLQPLVECLDINDVSTSELSKIWLSEGTVTMCIEDIHKVFVCCPDPQANLLMHLMPFIQIIFKMFCFCKKGVSHLRSSCQEILTTFLKCIDKSIAFNVLKALAFSSPRGCTDNTYLSSVMHPQLKFIPGEDGGIAVVTCLSAGETSDTEENDQDVLISCMAEIIKDLHKGGLAGEFFLYLLEELTLVISEVDEVKPNQCQDEGEQLLNIEQNQDILQRNNERRLVIMMLLMKMCETLDHTYLTSAEQVIKFAKATLLRSIYILENTDDVMTGIFESETITLAIGLLTATLSGAVEIKDDDRDRLKDLLPLLDKLASKHPEEEVQDMASDIRIAIATYGAVWTDSLASAAKKFSKGGNEEKKGRVKKGSKSPKLIEEVEPGEKKGFKLIQETSNQSADLGGELEGQVYVGGDERSKETVPAEEASDQRSHPDSGHSDSGHNIQPQSDTSLLQQSLNELCDPMIPVRGHALITLAKLIREKDDATLKKKDLMVEIFKENIAHDDSYIYLAAINGLASLAELYPAEILPVLVEEFIVVDSRGKPRAAELRMKVGEVLMKVSRSLGDVIPKYRAILMNAFLAGCKDSDHLIRASSLSNLGQVCQLLRFSLGNILQEVFLCTSALLKSDPAVEVRRAAAMVITMILRGVGHDAIQILDSVVKDAYRMLKHCYRTEKDDVVRLHAQLAFEELDKIMKTCIFPKQSLVKTIYVADKPS